MLTDLYKLKSPGGGGGGGGERRPLWHVKWYGPLLHILGAKHFIHKQPLSAIV